MNQRLRKLGGQEPPAPETPAVPDPEAVEGEGENEPAPGVAPDPKAPLTPGDNKKQSPWKLVTEYKELYTSAEQRALDLQKELDAIKGGQFPKDVQDRISKSESRTQELEDEIRYVNYEKSTEFKQKYQEPYEKAWKRAMDELGELTIQNEGAPPRQVTSQDMLDIVNLPLGKARELANSLYGDFANDVMQHRKEIRSLYDQRVTALEEAKKTGAEREGKLKEQHQKVFGEITDHIKTEWGKAQEEALSDEKNGKYFKPVEGDDEWNTHLQKGFEFADSAMSENPLNPDLTPEQRAKIVRKHAAMRNRAAAYGPMKYKLGALETKVAELEKELSQFKSSQPRTGGDQTTHANGGPADAREAMFSRLRAAAK
jgi:hypothetical protein